MKKEFYNKNIIVTGASSGLGREVCLNLDVLGANLVLVGRNIKNLNKTKSLMKRKHDYILCDLANLKDTKKKIKAIFTKKKFDGLVHGAGDYLLSPIQMVDEKEITNSININLMSPYLITKEFCKRKNYNEGASIVFVSSVAGFIGSSSLSVYSMTKSGQIGLVKSLAVEMASKKVRINSVAPGLIDSNISNILNSSMTKESFENIKKKHLLGLGKYSDVVTPILFLLSEKNKWITGSNLVIDGGYSIN